MHLGPFNGTYVRFRRARQRWPRFDGFGKEGHSTETVDTSDNEGHRNSQQSAELAGIDWTAIKPQEHRLPLTAHTSEGIPERTPVDGRGLASPSVVQCAD